MRKMVLGASMVCLSYSSASAAELSIDAVRKASPDFYEIVIANTVKGVEFSCALYDASGKVLAADTGYTDNLATTSLIRYSGDDAKTAKCVEN